MGSKKISSYFGLDTVLIIIFIVLKLCGLIDWSWWWVLSPVWISFAVAVGLFAGALLVHWWRNRDKASVTPVRCKDCLFAKHITEGNRVCDFTNRFVAFNDFCSKGVRR